MKVWGLKIIRRVEAKVGFLTSSDRAVSMAVGDIGVDGDSTDLRPFSSSRYFLSSSFELRSPTEIPSMIRCRSLHFPVGVSGHNINIATAVATISIPGTTKATLQAT